MHCLILFTNKVNGKLSNDRDRIEIIEFFFLHVPFYMFHFTFFILQFHFVLCLNGFIATYLLTFSNARLISIAPWVGAVRISTIPPRNSSVKPGHEVSANWKAFNNSSTICVDAVHWPLSSQSSLYNNFNYNKEIICLHILRRN